MRRSIWRLTAAVASAALLLARRAGPRPVGAGGRPPRRRRAVSRPGRSTPPSHPDGDGRGRAPRPAGAVDRSRPRASSEDGDAVTAAVGRAARPTPAPTSGIVLVVDTSASPWRQDSKLDRHGQATLPERSSSAKAPTDQMAIVQLRRHAPPCSATSPPTTDQLDAAIDALVADGDRHCGTASRTGGRASGAAARRCSPTSCSSRRQRRPARRAPPPTRPACPRARRTPCSASARPGTTPTRAAPGPGRQPPAVPRPTRPTRPARRPCCERVTAALDEPVRRHLHSRRSLKGRRPSTVDLGEARTLGSVASSGTARRQGVRSSPPPWSQAPAARRASRAATASTRSCSSCSRRVVCSPTPSS